MPLTSHSSFRIRQVAQAACLFLWICLVIPFAGAQPKRSRPAPNYPQFSAPDQAKGRELVSDFRERTLGDGYFEFELRFMPRRGEDRVTPGRMFLGRNSLGPVSRTSLWPDDPVKEIRLLVQNGPASRVWRWQPTDAIAIAPLGAEALFAPLADTDLTPFDLQMPYLFWPEFVYEGTVKIRGRLADSFLFYPPTALAEQQPELTGVRVYVDTQFHAMVQSEWIGEGNRILKTLQMVDFKKVDEQWVVKTIDLRNEKTRDRTRFLVKGAAMGIAWPQTLFEDTGLAAPAPLVSKDRIRSVAP